MSDANKKGGQMSAFLFGLPEQTGQAITKQ